MSKVLVTGGLGFIGSKVGMALLERGYEVTFLDDLSRLGSSERIVLLDKWKKSCQIVIGNVVEIHSLIEVCDFEYVIHCAAQVAVTTSMINPELDFSTNSVGTFRLLEWIRSRNTGKFKKIIYSSTNKIYGDFLDLDLKQSESRYMCNQGNVDYVVSEARQACPRTPYGLSKYIGEMLVAEWSRSFGLGGVVLRKSCIYGEGQMGIVDQGWVSYIHKCISTSGRVDIFGDGKQVRDLLNVDDLVDLYLKIINSANAEDFSIFNVGGGLSNSYSVLEVVEYFASKLKKKIDVTFHSWRNDDQRYYVSDITKATESFGWLPIRKLESTF